MGNGGNRNGKRGVVLTTGNPVFCEELKLYSKDIDWPLDDEQIYGWTNNKKCFATLETEM